MSHSVTTALYNQTAQEVLHAADFDVWVAYDGGTVIVIQGPAGGNGWGGASSGNPNTPAGNPSPDETTEITVPAVTTGTGAADRFSAGQFTPQSATPTAAQSSVEWPTITPSTSFLSTLMSDSQVPTPSMSSLLETSETQSQTVSNIVGSSSSSTESLSVAPMTLPTAPSVPVVASAEPSSTVTPFPTSSEYLSRSPPFYVAIILGSIAGVAVLAALIAWAFRRQAHERRRRLVDSAAKLPWVSTGRNDHDHDGSANPSAAPDVETAMRTTNTEVGVINLGSREDMAYLQSWEPMGDRDVGEPKRSECYADRKSRPPFITQQIPSHALFSPYTGQQFVVNTATSPCANRTSLGSIDPHFQVDTLGRGSPLHITNQVPGDISVSSSQEVGYLSPISEIGTPRELVPMPRFLGLEGKALDLPWEEKASTSKEDPPERKAKSRIMSAEHIRKTWDRHTSNFGENPSTMNTETLKQEPESDGWANSLKSNLVNAFNVVTAITAIKEGKDGTESRFTPARPKRSFNRKALRHSSPIQDQDKAEFKSSLTRGCTIRSSESDPWSFVQTGSNTGVVHIRFPSSDACSVLSHETPSPSFGVSRFHTPHCTEPLHVKKNTSVSLPKGRLSISSKDSRVRAPFSRGSSADGTISPKRHRKSPGGSMKRKITFDRRSSPLFSRTTSMVSSSSTVSTVSIVTGTEDMREKRLMARDALKERRRKAKGQKEISLG